MQDAQKVEFVIKRHQFAGEFIEVSTKHRIHISISIWRVVWGSSVGFAIIAGAMIWAVRSYGDIRVATKLASVLLACPLLLVLVIPFRGQAMRRRQFAAAIKKSGIDGLLAELPLIPGISKESVVAELAGADITDVTILWQGGRKVEEIRPLEVSFDPFPLRDTHPLFRDLQDSTNAPGTAIVTAADPNNGRSRRENWFRRDERLIVRVLMGCLVAPALGALAHTAWRRGTIDRPLLVLTILLCSLPFIPFDMLSLLSSANWLLVPGGLIRRTPGSRYDSSDLRLFDRRKCVLFVGPASQFQWRALVGSSSGAYRLPLLTESEMVMLLRCWLSSLPPPSIERLTDFR